MMVIYGEFTVSARIILFISVTQLVSVHKIKKGLTPFPLKEDSTKKIYVKFEQVQLQTSVISSFMYRQISNFIHIKYMYLIKKNFNYLIDLLQKTRFVRNIAKVEK